MSETIGRKALLAFLRSHRYAVQASVGRDGTPQAAVVGIAVADTFEIIFDTVDSSRKAGNLVDNQRMALVVGGTGPAEERTVQIDGTAERLRGADQRLVEEVYFGVFPDGRTRIDWKGIMYVRVTPHRLRYSDFRSAPPAIVTFDAEALAKLR